MNREERDTPEHSVSAQQRDAELLRRAAKEVAEVMYEQDPDEKPQHKGCCTAIQDVCEGRAWALRERFEAVFKPANAYLFWFGNPENAKNRPVRVLALCFMAAMVETGDA